jgi:ribonuclease MRP protein subunit RMP1
MTTTTSPKSELLSISQTLHLFHHRNQNQHRLAKWYKSLTQLRSHISRLILELETLDTALTYSSEESKYVQAARETVEDRVKFMRTWLEERAYVAFSNLVADNQYAAMGLFLLGTLARVRTLTGPLGRERGGDEDKDEAVEEVAGMGIEKGRLGIEREETYDFGEVVRREDLLEPSEDKEEGDQRDPGVKSTKKRKSLLHRGEDVELQTPTKRARQGKLVGFEKLNREDDAESEVGLKPSKKAKREVLLEDEEEGRSAPALTAPKIKRKEPDKNSPSEAVPSKDATKTKKKKKRKKGDAFDDLFDSLI